MNTLFVEGAQQPQKIIAAHLPRTLLRESFFLKNPLHLLFEILAFQIFAS